MIGIDDFHHETPTEDNNAFEKEYFAAFDQFKQGFLPPVLLNVGNKYTNLLHSWSSMQSSNL